MRFSTIASSIMAFAIAAEAAAIAVATPMETTLDVSTPGEIFKRDNYLDVFGSGGSRSATGGGDLSVSVSCGTITVSNYDGYSGLCTAVMAGGFSGCDGCEWFGQFKRYAIRVSTKCGNAHTSIGAGSDSGGGGEIGENIMAHDCNGKAGGGAKTMDICAGPNWSCKDNRMPKPS